VDRVLFAPRPLPDLRADVAQDPGPYDRWVRSSGASHVTEQATATRLLTLVMLFDASAPPELVHTLQSLENQTSDRWTLIAVVPSSLQTTFTALLSVSGLRRSSARVHTLAPPETSGSLERFEMAIAGSASDVALIFPGDVWAPGAVADLSNALRWGGVAYADEDRVSIEGHHYQPQLKPRYSPEFLLHSFYTGRPFALSADVVARLPAAAEADSLQFEHDLALRACEVAIDVVHIPQILCHKMDRSAEAQSVVPAAGTGHVRRALQRRGESGTVSHSTHQGLFSIRASSFRFETSPDFCAPASSRSMPHVVSGSLNSYWWTTLQYSRRRKPLWSASLNDRTRSCYATHVRSTGPRSTTQQWRGRQETSFAFSITTSRRNSPGGWMPCAHKPAGQRSVPSGPVSCTPIAASNIAVW